MEYVRDDEKAAREGIKNCYLGQLTQMWVGGVKEAGPNFYKSLFLWHIWPLLFDENGKFAFSPFLCLP